MDYEELLRRLDAKQISILFWKMREVSDLEIAKKFGNNSVDWTEKEMTLIYKALEVPSMPPKLKKKLLDEDILPAVKLITNDDEDTLITWDRDKQTPRRQTKKTVDKPADNRRQSGETKDTKKKFPWQIVALAVVFLIAVAGAYWWGTMAQATPLSTPTETQEFTQTLSVTATLESTSTVALTITPTETPIPTSTVPSNTPVPTPFREDFSRGLGSDMTVIFGTFQFPNQTLYAATDLLVEFGQPGTRFTIEYDVLRTEGCQFLHIIPHGVGFGPDPENMILFMWSYCDAQWYEVVNGTRNPLGDEYRGYRFSRDEFVNVKMIVDNGSFSAYLNNVKNSDFFDERFTEGKFYILLNDGETLDNVVIR